MKLQRLGGVAVAAACTLAACGGGSSTPIDAAPPPPIDAANNNPPSPVTNFTATSTTPGSVDLAWTNPTDADFAGVIIVRHLIDPVAGAPVTGTSYAVNDTLGTGDTVVYAGTGTAFT